MSRLGAWFRGSTPRSSHDPSPSTSQVDFRAQSVALLNDAIAGADLIMNDDIDGAEERLKKGSSTYHSFGLAVCVFMKSILGFEKAIMLEASKRLGECETSAWNEIKKAEREAGSSGSQPERIYPPGTEYQLVLAESYLMSAIIGVLHESLTEGIKSFYKLRKAYIALDGIIQAENAYLKKRQQGTTSPNRTAQHTDASQHEKMPGAFVDDDDDTDAEFLNADEPRSGDQTTEPGQDLPSRGGFETGPDSDIFADPVDAFTHSGATMCFGVLLLIISLVPPAFSRLLSVIGFGGDRERGIKMLWQSSQFENVNGAVSGLMLLAYYNGLLGFADILPSDADVEKGAIVGYPQERLTALLAKLRARYPDSGLWRFEEARSRGNKRDLNGALDILRNNKSKMKQVAALNNFEMSLDSSYVRDWSHARDDYLRCIELNDWSPSLYYYLAGCAELELYRNAHHENPDDRSQINLHKKKADELLRKVTMVAGKKRFMARPLPFEEFVVRKLKKWEERSGALSIDLVDAIGISPMQEMVYLWNGLKKMQDIELEAAAKDLSWDRLTCPEEARGKIQAEIDEGALHDLCHAAILRNLGKLDEARTRLQEVLKLDKSAFKGSVKDDYIPPSAHYEMAVLAWMEGQGETAAETKKKVYDCQSWLDKVSKWESYLLDGRIGMRVQTGMDTLRWYKREHGLPVS
ncbi:putative mitochondrial outer membrane protein iml2 [Rosellinia necatrix]|uniref:Inclusion body clearance protein IML2 n=1 Tax=Rosellinia necatrix TaxID=77044 RepID=A0A1S7UI06_ROSNE|nr:putative mitochondrial outer membrane protein iml2 [Rosellinia necatrix]